MASNGLGIVTSFARHDGERIMSNGTGIGHFVSWDGGSLMVGGVYWFVHLRNRPPATV